MNVIDLIESHINAEDETLRAPISSHLRHITRNNPDFVRSLIQVLPFVNQRATYAMLSFLYTISRPPCWVMEHIRTRGISKRFSKRATDHF